MCMCDCVACVCASRSWRAGRTGLWGGVKGGEGWNCGCKEEDHNGLDVEIRVRGGLGGSPGLGFEISTGLV